MAADDELPAAMEDTDLVAMSRLNSSATANYALNSSALNQAGHFVMGGASPMGGSGRLRGVVGDLQFSSRAALNRVTLADSGLASRTAGTPQH